MAKYRFIGERTAALSSSPPGVVIHVRPGETFEADEGFAYLRGDVRFEEIVEEKEAPQTEEKVDVDDDPKPKKTRK